MHVVVASLGLLPAGSYVLNWTATANDFNTPAEIIICSARVNGRGVADAAVVVGNSQGSGRVLTLASTTGVTLTVASQVDLECWNNTQTTSATIQNPRLTAIQTATMTQR